MAISISFMVYHVQWYLMYLVLPNPWSSFMFRPKQTIHKSWCSCCKPAHDKARIHVKHLHNRPAKVPLMAPQRIQLPVQGDENVLFETISTSQDYLIQDLCSFHMFKICSSSSSSHAKPCGSLVQLFETHCGQDSSKASLRRRLSPALGASVFMETNRPPY